ARTVLGRRAVAGVHGLAVDARMVVHVVMQEAAGRPALRLALEIAERAVVVFIGGAERTHLPGRRIDGHTDRCPADRRPGHDEVSVGARARAAAMKRAGRGPAT